MDALPEELLVLIARHVPDGSLPSLALVCRDWYRPARLATMWTTQGSDSAFRFSKLLQDKPSLAPLVRALVVDRIPVKKDAREAQPPQQAEPNTPAAAVAAAIAAATAAVRARAAGTGPATATGAGAGAGAGFALQLLLNQNGAQRMVTLQGPTENWLEDSFDELVMRPKREIECQTLFDLSIQLVQQAPLLQRFFLLAPPPSWGESPRRGQSDAALAQQVRLLDAVAKLDQLCVLGIWDEGSTPQIQVSILLQYMSQTSWLIELASHLQLRFAAFRYLLETAPPKLRNLSWPCEGPFAAMDMFDGLDSSDDDSNDLPPHFRHDAPSSSAPAADEAEEDLSPLRSRRIGDIQLTLFHLTPEHYALMADAIFPGARRITLDISTSENSVPTPAVIKLLFDEQNLDSDRLEWLTVDVACLPETSNPLALGLRPRWPTLALAHDNGLFAVMGRGPLTETDRERFSTLRDNSVITKAIVWKRDEMEAIVGKLETLVPGVEVIEVQ